MRRIAWREAGPYLVLPVILAAFGFLVVRQAQASSADRWLTLAAFLILVLPYLFFAGRGFRDRFGADPGPSWLALPVALLLAHLLFLAGPGAFRPGSLFLLWLYIGVPILLAHRAARRSAAPNRWDWAAAAALYLPVELGLIAPAWEAADPGLPDPSHPLAQLVAMNLALFCFLVVRKLQGVGFDFRLGRNDLLTALVAFALFFPLALVLGVASGFLPFAPHLTAPAAAAGQVLGVLFFVALPEEIFFRGILQNLMERVSPGPAGRRWALAAASVVFGLSHLNNHPLGDWRYVSLATLAGLFYGAVYARTRKVTASAVTHGLVDIVWRLFF